MLPPFPPAPRAVRTPPRVSIVITNRNYARFLRTAVDSALAQRGADSEVIVVDDGSTDESREILAGYGPRIRLLVQDNQGQKGAFNTGLAASSGEVVMFLDADDELHPDAAAAVASAFAAHPDASRVSFRLEVVDEEGRSTGACLPARAVPLAEGDVREALLAFPHDLAWPPASGNAFAAWALRRLMPLPLDDDPSGADMWLHPLVPLFGPVVALDRIGGSYRLHASNAHLRERFDADRSRVILRRSSRSDAELERVARELGHPRVQPRSVTTAVHRLISLRLGGSGHPIPGDSRWQALAAGLAAARSRFDVRPARRAAYGAWFVLAAFAPAPVVRAIARGFLEPVRDRSVVDRVRELPGVRL